MHCETNGASSRIRTQGIRSRHNKLQQTVKVLWIVYLVCIFVGLLSTPSNFRVPGMGKISTPCRKVGNGSTRQNSPLKMTKIAVLHSLKRHRQHSKIDLDSPRVVESGCFFESGGQISRLSRAWKKPDFRQVGNFALRRRAVTSTALERGARRPLWARSWPVRAQVFKSGATFQVLSMPHLFVALSGIDGRASDPEKLVKTSRSR